MIADKPLVLIVDDDEDSRYVYGRLLTHRGFDVMQTDSAIVAVQLARTLGPAAIIMDYLLPDMTGWEATRQLKGDLTTAAIPVVNVTAYSYPGIAADARAAGCDAFVAKPCDPFDVVQAVVFFTGPPAAQLPVARLMLAAPREAPPLA